MHAALLICLLKGELSTLLWDLRQFTSYFAVPISESVAHIYLSALAFSPTCSFFHEIYERCQGMVTVKRGRPLNWPLLLHTFHHTDRVNCVAFSPDGTQIVSGSDDKTIRVWNVETRAAVGEPLVGHTRAVRSVAFSPDGTQIVSGSYDNTIRVWNVETRAAVGEPLIGHTSLVTSVALSPDGTQIVSGSHDKTIRVWNVETCAAVGEPLTGHTNWVRSVAFSPDGTQIVSGSEEIGRAHV